ncbi:MAG: hypothetical protein K1X88_11815 [Nannocystaceae bacterium]|nr:hypothetical protein [Nannocystaceae bacterium]
MRRTALARPALSSVLSLALAFAPWEVAEAGPAAKGASKPTTTAAPADTPATTDTATPPADTAPADTAPADTAPADTAPADTAAADTDAEPAGATDADTEGEAKDTEGEAKDTEGAPEDTEGAAEPPPPEPAADPMADRPPEPQVAGKPRKGLGLMIAGGTVLAAGLASTITFGLVTQHCKYSGPLKCKFQDQDDFLIPLGSAVTLLGAVLLGVGVGYRVSYQKWERWTPEVAAREKAKAEKRASRGRRKKSKAETAFSPAMLRGGAGIVVGGRF